MRNKIKRIITSLALAASLVLAPMNVSADNVQITQDNIWSTDNVAYVDPNASTKVPKVTKVLVRTLPTYTIEVPDSVTINVTDPASGGTADLDIELKAMNTGAKKLNVGVAAFAQADSLKKADNTNAGTLTFSPSGDSSVSNPDLTAGPVVQFSGLDSNTENNKKTITLTLAGSAMTKEKLGPDFGMNDNGTQIGTVSYDITLS